MSTDQLKLIIDMINGLGGQGKEAFIWWLALTKGLEFIGYMTAAVLLFIVATRAVRYVYECHKPSHGTRLENAHQAVTHWWLAERGEAGTKAFEIREELLKIMKAAKKQ